MTDPTPIALAELRNEYTRESLDERSVDADPFRQFDAWMREALEAKVPEPTAMTVATIDAHGRPAARICLLKGADERGFVFYTNYESRKGHDLAAHPSAALVFFWKELERQVRIEGTVEKVTPEESDAYYRMRPLGSRIGAWASPQSARLASREWLEARWSDLSRAYGEDPPRPAHWGGYRVLPEAFEFWQGRRSRLHDRVVYARADGAWSILRLAP